MKDISNYENPTKKKQKQHFKELEEIYSNNIWEGDIYLKLYNGTVIGATTNFEKAYNWFYDDECDIQLWNDCASFIIDDEEILDIYSQFGFNYVLDIVTK